MESQAETQSTQWEQDQEANARIESCHTDADAAKC